MGYTPIDISTPNDGQGDPLRDAFNLTNQMFEELYQSAVFKVAGKDLSSNDFTDLLQTKLNGIEDNAEVNVQSNLTEDDDTQDSFVIGKEAFFNSEPRVIDGIIGVTPGFVAGQQTFNLPENNSIVVLIVLNGEVQYKETPQNSALENTYIQNVGSATIKRITETNNYLYIEYK